MALTIILFLITWLAMWAFFYSLQKQVIDTDDRLLETRRHIRAKEIEHRMQLNLVWDELGPLSRAVGESKAPKKKARVKKMTPTKKGGRKRESTER